ncbi:response regulator [Pseudomonas stutzeri]|uniref:response regulator n=1 Tax=Stutzerimonas stutzeri TaxID=316 RepID=UPI00210E616D|nr:response regulator [Stutzerimonas stutzeri]MCQ4313902.1 response regulator [Stutzerimonas stutzeri]
MKILIVEDEFDKREKIISFLKSDLGQDCVEIIEAESLRSGLRMLITNSDIDIVLLDMSMPGYDVTTDEPGGGDPESYAGKELMSQMRLRNIKVPVVVITQYKKFKKENISLDELTQEFEEQFPEFFWGTIHFSSAIEGWKKSLSDYLNKI